MRFVKAHGLGNDYLVLTSGEPIDPATCRAICDRHTGLGSDGILEPFATDRADHGVRIWNPDGSVAEKSGNGLRIFASWAAVERGAGESFSVWTGACRVGCRVHDPDDVTVDMGRATTRSLELDVDGGPRSLVAVDLGNPHCVWFVDEPLDALPWRSWGATLEVHPAFPNRTNVQVARVLDGVPHLRIWERGAGETSASGSSSCAVVAAGVATGRLAAGTHAATMPGGVLEVTVGSDLDVRLRGPVAWVARMEWLG